VGRSRPKWIKPDKGQLKLEEITPYVPRRLRYESEGFWRPLRFAAVSRPTLRANYVIGRNSDNNKLDYATRAN